MKQITIDDVKCSALIGSEAQLSTIKISFAQELGLELQILDQFLRIKAIGVEISPI